MPNVCAGGQCQLQYRPSRKGCGGRQYVLVEYLQYAKELLKEGAKDGDWICATCRNTIRLRAATFGADLSGDSTVCACRMIVLCA